jgi:hypothetical protein
MLRLRLPSAPTRSRMSLCILEPFTASTTRCRGTIVVLMRVWMAFWSHQICNKLHKITGWVGYGPFQFIVEHFVTGVLQFGDNFHLVQQGIDFLSEKKETSILDVSRKIHKQNFIYSSKPVSCAWAIQQKHRNVQNHPAQSNWWPKRSCN